MAKCLASDKKVGYTYGQPLSVINLAGAEQGVQRVVAGDDEASNVDKELASNVEEDEEEIQAGETQDGVGLGDGGLLLKVVECGVLGQLEHNMVSIRGFVQTLLRLRLLIKNTYTSRILTIVPCAEARALTSLSSCDSWAWALSWTDMLRAVWGSSVVGCKGLRCNGLWWKKQRGCNVFSRLGGAGTWSLEIVGWRKWARHR